MTTEKIRLFGVSIDPLTLPQATTRLLKWATGRTASRCRYVVTPNVDHVVKLQRNLCLQDAYLDASMVVADGAPLVAASRLLRKPLPERVAGSDLVPSLLAAADAAAVAGGPRLRLFLLGAAPGVADRAAQRIGLRWPNVETVGTLSPPLGFENNPNENERILDGADRTDTALEQMTDLLPALPGERIVVVAINEDGILGAIAAARTLGRDGDLYYSGQGTDPSIWCEIRDNPNYVASTAYFPERYGEILIPAAQQILAGETVDEFLFTEHEIITSENIEDIYDVTDCG